MQKDISVFRWSSRIFTFVGKIFRFILNYLSCSETETLNDRNLLRELYNAGHIDEIKYQDCCERCSKGDFDPEELQTPM
jgi:hypothetical protein